MNDRRKCENEREIIRDIIWPKVKFNVNANLLVPKINKKPRERERERERKEKPLFKKFSKG